MSTIINGDAAAVSNSLTRTVNDATNTNPIVLQTTVAHGFYTGDTVIVDDVGGNDAANGTWEIVVTDGTHLQLVGSDGTASGAYTSGGTALNYALMPAATVVSDGDGPLEAADVAVALEVLLDRTQFLNKLIARGLAFQEQSVTRVIQGTPWSYSGWSPDIPANGSNWTVPSAQGILWIPLTLPHGATLTEITLYHKGNAGHGAFPGGAPTMPVITLLRKVAATGVETTVGTFTDASATAGAYEVIHAITLTGLSEVVDRTQQYILKLLGEGGANFIAGETFYCATATFSASQIDIGAA